MLQKLLLLLFTVAASTAVHAASFDFAAVADGDASYGAVPGEYGASSITFTNDGITVTATGTSTIDDDAFQFAYLDSTWTHSGTAVKADSVSVLIFRLINACPLRMTMSLSVRP